MLIWALYDVSDDKQRNHVAKVLLNAGLERVQYSVFVGDLDPNRFDELVIAAERIVEEQDSVYFFPQCRPDFDRMRIVGAGFDAKRVASELLTDFF